MKLKGLALAFAVAGLSGGVQAGVSDTQLSADAGASWLHTNGNLAAYRYSTLDQINAGNAKKLKLAWIMSPGGKRSEEHTSELRSPDHLVCRLLLEKKKKIKRT